jgi:CRISPR/Cas system-associated exonuclease Cas4 (RecB family)
MASDGTCAASLDDYLKACGEAPGPERLLSASQMNMFLTCPRQWYYKYVERLPEVESFYQVRGKAVHSVCERFFDYRPPGGITLSHLKKDLANRAQTLFDAAWKEQHIPDMFGDDGYNETFDMIKRFLQLRNWELEAMHSKCREAQKAWNWTKPKFRELHIMDEELWVECYIDSVIERDGDIIIVDYKTSNIFKFPLTREYELQLYIYALLYENKTGITPKYVAFEYLNYGKVNTLPVHPVFLEEVQRTILDVRSKTESRDISDYRQCPGGLCKYCSFYETCLPKMPRTRSSL